MSDEQHPDGCEVGNHRRDALCGMTTAKSLPPVDEPCLFAGISDVVQDLADEWVPKLRAFNEPVWATTDEREGAT